MGLMLPSYTVHSPLLSIIGILTYLCWVPHSLPDSSLTIDSPSPVTKIPPPPSPLPYQILGGSQQKITKSELILILIQTVVILHNLVPRALHVRWELLTRRALGTRLDSPYIYKFVNLPNIGGLTATVVILCSTPSTKLSFRVWPTYK